MHTWQPTRHSYEKINQENHHKHQKNHQFRIFPPHSPPQTPTSHPKLHSPSLQPCSFINQKIDPLPPLQHPLDILRHDTSRTLNLPLGLLHNIFILPALRKLIHRVLKRGVKLGAAIWGSIADGRPGVAGREETLNLEKVTERDLPAESGRGDHEEGETLGNSRGGRSRDVVDVVGGVGVG